tara:strand:- start:1835 stop:3157 length:1323 start_codon:yes stop_codon:yes gene_type:complete
MAASLKKVQELDKLLKVSQYDRKINFGRRDASIEFGTANSSLIISGSNSGIVMSGSGIYVDATTVVAGSAADTNSFLALDSDNKIIKSSVAGGSARSVSGDTDNGIISWVTSDNTFAVESNLTFDGTDLTLAAAGKINFRDTNSFINSPTANDLEIVATDIVLDAVTLIDLQSDAVHFGEGGDTDIVLTFNANSSDGEFKWMEDEDYFEFSDDVLIATNEKLQFRDGNSYINSPSANDLEIVATDIVLDAATLIDLQSDAVSIGEGGDTDVVLTFNANTSDGSITWMEDESEFYFSSPIKGKIYYYTHHNFNYTGTAKIYIPINSPVENTDITYVFVHMIAPYNGKLVKVIINADGDHAGSGTAPGSTVIGLHLDQNTTAATTVTETLAQASAGVGVTTTYNFTSNNTFNKNQFLSISVDATAQLYDARVTCVWEYDTTT